MGASFRPSDDETNDEGVVAEINITPLTDVFLVLLIIFMVTTSVIQNQGKNIDLPGAEVADTTPKGVTVTVSPEGGMLVNDEPIQESQLFDVLKAKLDSTSDKIVILRGDKKVLLGEAVNILDVAQRAGATGIALATKPPAEEG